MFAERLRKDRERRRIRELISSAALPRDRRMRDALMRLAGLRHGEMAGVRWRNYDPTRDRSAS